MWQYRTPSTSMTKIVLVMPLAPGTGRVYVQNSFDFNVIQAESAWPSKESGVAGRLVRRVVVEMIVGHEHDVGLHRRERLQEPV